MPMDYLRSIEYVDLPLRVTDQHSLECIQVLLAAGLVDATLQPGDPPGSGLVAEVRAITVAGRVALVKYAQGKPFE